MPGNKKRKRNHRTTKNTVTRPPVTRMMEYSGDCNGPYTILTDHPISFEFQQIYETWFESPDTRIWNIHSFIEWFKDNYPKYMIMLKSDYDKMLSDGIVESATEQEWEEENK